MVLFKLNNKFHSKKFDYYKFSNHFDSRYSLKYKTVKYELNYFLHLIEKFNQNFSHSPS